MTELNETDSLSAAIRRATVSPEEMSSACQTARTSFAEIDARRRNDLENIRILPLISAQKAEKFFLFFPENLN